MPVRSTDVLESVRNYKARRMWVPPVAVHWPGIPLVDDYDLARLSKFFAAAPSGMIDGHRRGWAALRCKGSG
jgi:hypothetical protein